MMQIGMIGLGRSGINIVKGLQRDGLDSDISSFKDDTHRGRDLRKKDILDVGTSGGVWGLGSGGHMMVGGATESVDLTDPILDASVPGADDSAHTSRRENITDTRAERGYIHTGPSIAGHFVQVVQNGIEHKLMLASPRRFRYQQEEELAQADRQRTSNLTNMAEAWRVGSVISSWLLDLTASALTASPKLGHSSGVLVDVRTQVGFGGHVEHCGAPAPEGASTRPTQY